jgi:hypothetical protein
MENKHKFIDWNTLEMDQLVEHLKHKFMFDSSGTAFSVYKLIEFYENANTEVVERETPVVYRGDAIPKCPLGLYEVFWNSGGSSVASIGNMYDGTRWLAPTNWTADVDKDPTGRIDDEMVLKIDRIVLLYTQNR